MIQLHHARGACVEPLEPRTFLSATVSGTYYGEYSIHYYDLDGSEFQGTGEFKIRVDSWGDGPNHDYQIVYYFGEGLSPYEAAGGLSIDPQYGADGFMIGVGTTLEPLGGTFSGGGAPPFAVSPYFDIRIFDANSVVLSGGWAPEYNSQQVWGSFFLRKPIINADVTDTEGRPLHGVRVTASNGVESDVEYSDYNYGSTELDDDMDGHVLLYGSFEDAPFTLKFEYMYVNAKKPFSYTKIYQRSVFDADHFADLGTIKLPNYTLTDAAGQIYMHRDLRVAANSDYIRPAQSMTQAQKSIASYSARYRATVRALTGKLHDLGFRQDDATAKVLSPVNAYTHSSPAERAVMLFQVLWYNEAFTNSMTLALAGKLRVADGPAGTIAGETLKALNRVGATKGALWINTLSKAFSYQPTANRWMNASTAKRLEAVASGMPGAKLWFTSASTPTGGKFAPHESTHGAGGEADLKWITANYSNVAGDFYEAIPGSKTKISYLKEKTASGSLVSSVIPDPAQEGIAWRVRGTGTQAVYDRAETTALVAALINNGARQVIFNDPSILSYFRAITITDAKKGIFTRNRKVLTFLAGHSNHVHAGFAYKPGEQYKVPATTKTTASFAAAVSAPIKRVFNEVYATESGLF